MIQDSRRQKTIINFLSVILLVMVVFLLSNFVKESEVVREFITSFGYIGLLFVSILSGFNIIIPIPAIAFLPLVLSVGLNVWISVAVITVGMTIGDGVGYLLGRTGRTVIDEDKLPKFLRNCDGYLYKHPRLIPVFLFLYASFAPVPNELVVIPLSFVERRWWVVLIPVLFGNAIFNTLAVLGIMSIPGLI